MKVSSGCLVTLSAIALLAVTSGTGAASNADVVATSGTTTAVVTQTSATTVRRVSPLNGDGHLRARYTVTTSGRGYCWTASFMNGRLYRCFKGDNIMDPCWKEAGRNSVVCLGLPWSTTLARLRLTRRLPARSDYGPRIWGLRLGGGVGVNCLASTGAGGTVGKRPISYFCRRGWVLLGNGPNRSQSLWTMQTAKWVQDHYELRGRKPLPIAWEPVVG